LTDGQKAILITGGNFLLVILVWVTFQTQDDVQWWTFYVFAGALFAEVLLYALLVSRRSIWQGILTTFDSLLRALRGDTNGKEQDQPKTQRPQPTAAPRSPPLIPFVALNFAAIGWLIYRTGGAVESPYNQIPVMMLIFGQLLTGLRGEDKRVMSVNSGSDLIRLVLRAIWAFRLTWILGLVFFAGVACATTLQPVDVGRAPGETVALVTLLNLFIGTLVNFVVRQRRAEAIAQKAAGELPENVEAEG
jgi:hypothetical protein